MNFERLAGRDDEACGHVRPVPDLFGRAAWRCQLPARHAGSHYAERDGETSEWDHNGRWPLVDRSLAGTT